MLDVQKRLVPIVHISSTAVMSNHVNPAADRKKNSALLVVCKTVTDASKLKNPAKQVSL